MIFTAAPVRRTDPIPYATARTFAKCFRKLFAEPRRARQLFVAEFAKRGINQATVTLQLDPECFGTLRSGATGTRRREAVDAAYELAEAYYDFWQEQLLDKAPLLYEANDALAARHVIGIVSEYASATEETVRELSERRQHSVVVLRDFLYDFACVYGWNRRPLRALHKLFRSHGVDAVLYVLRECPETFGAFRKTEIDLGIRWIRRPLFRYSTSAPAREKLASLPNLFLRAAEVYSERPTVAELAAAKRRQSEAKEAVREATISASQYLRTVEEYVGEIALGLLRFAESTSAPPARWEALVRNLAPMLPPAALALARQSLARRRVNS